MEKSLGRTRVNGTSSRSCSVLNIQVLFPSSWILGCAAILHHTLKYLCQSLCCIWPVAHGLIIDNRNIYTHIIGVCGYSGIIKIKYITCNINYYCRK
jgi:hypothetical protein